MRRVIPYAIVATALLAIWLSYAHARNPQQIGGKAAQAWEYRILVLTDVVKVPQALQQEPSKTAVAIESRFNELGRDDWEYCGDSPGAAVFKRPKP
jgi:hypothetical protein